MATAEAAVERPAEHVEEFETIVIGGGQAGLAVGYHLKKRGRPERSIKGHEAVIEALAAGNGEAAADAMRRHIDQIADLLDESTTSVQSTNQV